MYQLGINPTLLYDNSASDLPGFELGSLGADSDGKIYQFVQSNGALVVGDVVVIDESNDATKISTTTSAPTAGQGMPVGVVLVATADNDWCWVQRYGVIAAINAATGCAAHTELNSTGTAGRLDDDATVGAEIVEGISITATAASNTAAGLLNWPYVGRTLVADAT